MNKEFSTDEKKQVAEIYSDGKSVAFICREFNLPKSTVYYWIKKYSKIQRPSGEVTDATKIYLLEKRIKRLESELAIWQQSDCSINSPISQKLDAIMNLHTIYGVHATCETLGVRRSTFYYHQRRRPEKTMVEKEDDILKPHIRKIFTDSKGRLGAKKIRIKLLELDLKVSAGRIVRLMKEMGISCVSSGNVKKDRKTGTGRYYKNKLKQRFTQTEPNRVWVSDITYLYANHVAYYLCVIIDLFSRKVISYALSENNDASLVIGAYKKACSERKPNKLMFHSDQGTQYTAQEFRALLREHGVTQSYSNAGYPYDNAVSESFFRALKSEEVVQHDYASFDKIAESAEDYIAFFNNDRPHQKLNYLTPNQFEENFFKEQK